MVVCFHDFVIRPQKGILRDDDETLAPRLYGARAEKNHDKNFACDFEPNDID